MRKITLNLLVLVFIPVILFTACRKGNINTAPEHTEEAVLISSDVDLDSFETTFYTDPVTGNLHITFSEPENFYMHPEQAEEMGFFLLEISQGLYTIIVPGDGSNYGELELDVKNYDLISDNRPGMGIRIDLARRWAICPGSSEPRWCECGWGVRCAFEKSKVELISAPGDRSTEGDIFFDEANHKLKIIFTSPLPED